MKKSEPAEQVYSTQVKRSHLKKLDSFVLLGYLYDILKFNRDR